MTDTKIKTEAVKTGNVELWHYKDAKGNDYWIVAGPDDEYEHGEGEEFFTLEEAEQGFLDTVKAWGAPPEEEEPMKKGYHEFFGQILPYKNCVCPRCRGEGTHTNPSIDGNGLTREDFDDDPDFREDYMSGMYDVVCWQCKGEKVIKVPDMDRMTDEQRKKHQSDIDDENDFKAVQRAELRAEMGMDFREDDLGYNYYN